MPNQMAPRCRLSGHRVLICYTRRFRQPPCAALNASRWRLIRHRLPGCGIKVFDIATHITACVQLQKVPRQQRVCSRCRLRWCRVPGDREVMPKGSGMSTPYNGPMCGLKCRRDGDPNAGPNCVLMLTVRRDAGLKGAECHPNCIETAP